MSDRAFRLAIYANGFVLGFVLMGFEMLGSRYLNPWFGSGINTWAALISVTLFALTVGYFIGGRMVDRWPTTTLVGWLVFLAALTMVLIVVPVGGFDGKMIEWEYLGETLLVMVGEAIQDERLGVTVAAMVLIFAPICLIACYSPFAVRLLLISTDSSGRQVGTVYGISTFGNILGTLFTTFWLVPSMGSKAITLTFAGICVLSAISLIWIGRRRRG